MIMDNATIGPSQFMCRSSSTFWKCRINFHWFNRLRPAQLTSWTCAQHTTSCMLRARLILYSMAICDHMCWIDRDTGTAIADRDCCWWVPLIEFWVMNLRPMTSFCRKMHVVFLIHRSSFLTILVIVHLNFKDKMPVHCSPPRQTIYQKKVIQHTCSYFISYTGIYI